MSGKSRTRRVSQSPSQESSASVENTQYSPLFLSTASSRALPAAGKRQSFYISWMAHATKKNHRLHHESGIGAVQHSSFTSKLQAVGSKMDSSCRIFYNCNHCFTLAGVVGWIVSWLVDESFFGWLFHFSQTLGLNHLGWAKKDDESCTFSKLQRLLFTAFSRAVFRCMGAAMFASVEWVQRCHTELFYAFSLDYLNGSITHTTERLVYTIVKGNCLFKVTGRNVCH